MPKLPADFEDLEPFADWALLSESDRYAKRLASTMDELQAFYDAALGAGAESLHAPRLWPEYHPGYFGAFVRDPDGNNVEAVFHGAGPVD